MAEPEGSLNTPTDSGNPQPSFQEGAKEEQVRHQHTSHNNLIMDIQFIFSSTSLFVYPKCDFYEIHPSFFFYY